MTDPVERRERLVCQDAVDVAQRGLDGICIRDRLPEGAVQITERREPARIIERIQQVAEARAVAAEVLLRSVSRAETRLGDVEVGGVQGGGIQRDVLPSCSVGNGGVPGSSASCSVAGRS